MITIGTSGYSYADWVGHYYPKGTESKDFLSYYAQHFKAVEINSTYYKIPNPFMFFRLLQKVPQDFEFVVKTPKEFTHQRQDFNKSVQPYLKGIEPLVKNNRLGTLLAQFPYSFKMDERNLEHIEKVKEAVGNIPLNVEFRNISWITKETYEFLRKQKIGFVNVDMPQLPNLIPPTSESTSSTAYFRFHGRNRAKWWHHEHAYERYDYRYKEDELKPWVTNIQKTDKKVEKTYVFFNNHYEGKAVSGAILLSKLMKIKTPAKMQEKEKGLDSFIK